MIFVGIDVAKDKHDCFILNSEEMCIRDRWQALAKTVAVQGMRNAYLLAVAPTSSTSIPVSYTHLFCLNFVEHTNFVFYSLHFIICFNDSFCRMK